MNLALRDRCRACDGRLAGGVLRMDPMPLAGAFADTREQALAAEKYPLTWVRCNRCTLVQVQEEVPDEVLYAKYSYASSTIPALVAHFESYARVLSERFGPQANVRVLEMGCNDGVLLRRMPEAWTRIGVDPSDVALRASIDAPYDFYHLPFQEPGGFGDGMYDLVIASNCLAHVTDIHGAIAAAHAALKEGGEFWVEVHDLTQTARLAQWDTVYHEHKAEYSLKSLTTAVTPHGFDTVYVERTPLHGGSLRVGFRKGRRGEPWGDESDLRELAKAYQWRRSSPIAREITYARNRGGLAAYGAAGRATVWLNQMGLRFDTVYDDSPLRAGRFVPGVGLPIVPWDGGTNTVVVTAWNYADAIKAAHPEYRGRWLQTFDVRESVGVK